MYDPVPSGRALQVIALFRKVVEGIVVNPARALEEVRADYSTTTEIADALMQRAGVPFRAGHHFASELTNYGRGKGLRLHEIPHAEAARLYQKQTGEPFPLTEAAFAEVISAEYMVFGRKGTGGPQPAEVRRMLAAERERLGVDRAWLKARNADLSRADEARQRAFSALAC
jgi:argininosuccinate lyase